MDNCTRCGAPPEQHLAIQYSYDHPEHYDGTSEFKCLRCGLRRGRWSGKILTSNGKGDVSSEPRYGVER